MDGEEVFVDQVTDNLTSGTQTPTFTGETPSRTGYTFAGWNPTVAETVTANAIYTATWTPANVKYTVKHLQQNLTDGSYVEVETDKETKEGKTGSQTEASAKSYKGFTAQSISQATIAADGTTVVEVKYDRNTHNVTYEIKGEQPSSSEGAPAGQKNVPYGTTVTVADPLTTTETEKNGQKGVWGFTWDRNGSFSMPDEDVTITGTWSFTVDKFTVKFLDAEGKELSSNEYAYGTKAEDIEVPTIPEKTADAQYTYEGGWNKPITDVTGNAEYQVVYTPTARTYTITWKRDEETVIDTTQVAYGESPSHADAIKEGEEGVTYLFTGWTPTLVAVTGEAVYTAQFDRIEDKKLNLSKKLTVTGTDTVPDATFAFTATATGDNAESAPSLAIPSISFTSTDALTDGSVTKTAEINLSSLSGWKAPGLYTYSIKETPDTFTNVEGSDGEKSEMTYDGTEYILTLRVTAGSTQESYVITEMAVAKKDGRKQNPSFENTYTYTPPTVPTTDLTVSKTVSGTDKKDDFSFTITFTAAENRSAVAPTVKTVNGSTELDTGTTISYGTPVKFTLKKDQSVTFTLPEGTSYAVGEAPATNYTPSVVITKGGEKDTEKSESGSLNQALTVEGASVATGSNSAAFTNTYTEPENPLTGIIEKNGPFLILILVAVLGFAFYLADRRRKARR